MPGLAGDDDAGTAGGDDSAEILQGVGDANEVDVDDRLRRGLSRGQDRGVSMAQVALAWVLHNPIVSAPIVGATKTHHLTDAVAALDLTLTDDEVANLEAGYTPRQPTYF